MTGPSHSIEYSTDRREEEGRWLPRSIQSIHGLESMSPFFMSVASPSNHWLFVSSLGSLTAGRKSVEQALFPYRTVDQIHDAAGKVGGRTLVRRRSDGALWEPFTERSAGLKGVSRSISRSAWGTFVTLSERHGGFGIEVRQTWTTSHERGVLRFCEVVSIGSDPVSVDLIDGVVDVLPAAVDPEMQARLSSLVTAYRMAELVDGVAIFTLGSIPLDRAAPNEALRGTTAWSTARGVTLLCESQLEAFRCGEDVVEEPRSRGVRGALLISRTLHLGPGEIDRSAMALEVSQAAADVERLQAWRSAEPDLHAALLADADRTELNLVRLLCRADSLQRTNSFAEDARHQANTLYNVMRGGLPIAEYRAPRLEDGLAPDAFRHAMEDLPLGFSRRHGDPSRPWNRFSIDVRHEDGSLKSAYEGNWRDIFQNWEALGVSYPAMLPGFVTRFLNASTADGYNPYRIDSSKGIDWEVEDPDDPWSHIGYWGDHQIVYLTRLLERWMERDPKGPAALLGQRLFVSADVPYRIAGFEKLVADPRNTVSFSQEVAQRVAAREAADPGKDARLLHDGKGELVHVTLEEKLLVPLLAKLSNFVPGAGVWMNTQRPEWNDANNALAGFGVSVVTAAALWRHVEVLRRLLAGSAIELTARTAQFLREVGAAIEAAGASTSTDARERWVFVRAVGRAGEKHRAAVYRGEGLGPDQGPSIDLGAFLGRAHALLGETLRLSRRVDGLYHAYQLLEFGQGAVEVQRLPLMLEGQAAVLGAGALSAADAVELLDHLRASPLYRDDLDSYLLYPDVELPGLLDRGVIQDPMAARDPLIDALLERGGCGIVRRSDEEDAVLRFGPEMHSVQHLFAALASLPEDLRGLALEHGQRLAERYEEAFEHATFTGRSGSFFGYEGLGCTYWHMVSKLALGVQETLLRAVDAGEPDDVTRALVRHYRAIRAGIGAQSTPDRYGAFPSEPYSHSPADGRVRQPGMTGQVKEDLLARVAEVGIRIRDGRLRFDPACVVAAEFCEFPARLPRPDESGLEIPVGAFAFTHCGVPVLVHRGDLPDGQRPRGRAHLQGGEVRAFDPQEGLDEELSAALFHRTGRVARLEVALEVAPD
ncbi:hypothetical protein Poly30_55730 [Planctomycetes bacterium Poly30]|uniref:Glycosyl hydrolase 36 catalytic domain-containing protein n=1 Tax=Saltatorellus ferox TaxID=2528018 RepID=A0A518F0Z1_9BACT|nr:hypothetical protein Poly30_55730 [Planctomycetes bacterium Poly30]